MILSKQNIRLVEICVLSALLIALLASIFVPSKTPSAVIRISPLPSNYTESEEDYEEYVQPETTELFESTTGDISMSYDSYSSTDTFEAVDTNINTTVEKLILLDDADAWDLISGGIYTEYPSGSYASNKDKVQQIYDTKMVMITVPMWTWERPNDKNNLKKTTTSKQLAVNSELAELFTCVFQDIYNDPSRPVINTHDAGMGTWVLRGKNHNSKSAISGHALGTTIDINPSTGSFKLNGTWYGNGYGHRAMSKSVWEDLPECQSKYNVLYKDCPIVQVFKSYGFVWGGDWTSGTDCMHFSFLGDGKNAREVGKQNYYKYN